MTKSQKDKRQSSNPIIFSSSPLEDERLTLKWEKERLKAIAKRREANIAASTAALSQKAIRATDTESRIEDEQKAHKAKQAERHNTRMAERKRLSILEGETEEKEKADDDQSLSEFMSIMGEVVSHSEPATLSPDNLDNIDKEENQGGNPTRRETAIRTIKQPTAK